MYKVLSKVVDKYTLFEILKKANISTDGLFINADAGFDAKDFRETCFRHGVIAGKSTEFDPGIPI